jgi:hypothetical protein
MKTWFIRFYHNLLKGFTFFHISKLPEAPKFSICPDEKAMKAFYDSLPRHEGLYKRLADM